MVFSSVIFLLAFLPITIAGYYIIPKKFRNYFLLTVSLVFFAWGSPRHLILLLVSILINFCTALLIERNKKNARIKRFSLILGVSANLGMLFYYKYLTFILSNISGLFSNGFQVPDIILPIGISFFTFQGMSYIIDVYRGKVAVNRHVADVALYISLFPQLIAGPIVNYKDIADQLHNRKTSSDYFADGIERFIIGLSKKILIADVMGAASSRIYAAFQRGVDAPSVWLAVICFTFQIYYDFSAYSDMAIGLGKMFGFDIMENFNYPYISTSVTEFWRRWHISLSTWFKDYLYIPLGGNRRGNVYVNLLIVFCATGIWHGADWQFLIWGLWHGLFLIVEKIMIKRGLLKRIPKAVRWITTMLIVIIGWVMFNAANMSSALEIYRSMFGLTGGVSVGFTWMYYLNRQVLLTLIAAVLGSAPLLPWIGSRLRNSRSALIVKRLALIVLLLVSIFNAVSGAYSPFIYFRF